MKKHLFSLLLAIVASIGTNFAEIYSGTCGEENSDGSNLTWKLDSETGILTITGAGGMANYWWNEEPSWYDYRESIKTLIINDGVTTIGVSAFRDYINLTNITLSNSITAIGSMAFDGCKGLATLTIPNNITDIGTWAFRGCTGLTTIKVDEDNPNYDSRDNCNAIIEKATNTLLTGCVNTTIPNSVTSIGDYAFSGCSGLTSVTIPNGVTTIETQAFYGCTNLTSITLPQSLTDIGNMAFNNCTNLTGVYISDIAAWCKIEFWDQPLFDAHNLYLNNELVTDLIIPDGVTEIGKEAFAYCTSLTSVNIPNSVTTIGKDAFRRCTSLPIDGGLRYAGTYLIEAVNENITTANIKEGTRWIGSSAFYSCSNLTEVTIPNSVTVIGEGAFNYCSNLTEINIPHSVTTIEEDAFGSCSGLTSITIPNSVTTIDKYAFSHCTGLTSITIPNSVTTIGEGSQDNSKTVFYDCTNLTKVTINSNAIVSKAYSYDSGIKDFFGEQVTEYILGEDVTAIGNYAFSNCANLTSVTIPNSVTTIGEDAFYYCTHLTTITLPNSVTEIGGSAFYNCTGLTAINIPDGLTAIGDYTFYDCIGLTNVIIGDGVTNIGESAFSGCEGLTNVIIGDGVTNIGESAFYGCTNLTRITIPSSVTTIGRGAFQDCTSLTGVYISDLVAWCKIPYLGSNPLYYAHNLYLNNELVTELIIPNGVRLIRSGAFQDCTSLTSITFPNTVTTIESRAFQNCINLKSVTFGTGIEGIWSSAFRNDSLLSSITIYAERVPAVNDNLDGVSREAYLYVPAALVNEYKEHEVWGEFNVQPISAETINTEEVSVIAYTQSANITWSKVEGAVTYNLTITNNEGNEVCNIVFNSEGQLQTIAYRAPARSKAQEAAQQTGFRFIINGLDTDSSYTYTIIAKNATDSTIESYTGTFTTNKEVSTAIEDVEDTDSYLSPTNKPQKVYHNGQILILTPDGRTYNVQGAEVK